MNGTHQLLIYADDVNLLSENINNLRNENINIIKKNKHIMLDARKYMQKSFHQNAGENRNTMILYLINPLKV
jgi:hypothetical protein